MIGEREMVIRERDDDRRERELVIRERDDDRRGRDDDNDRE